MVEKETHVDNMSSGEQTDICQILFDIVEDQSEVCRRAKRAISGLSQSNWWRLGKSDGEPGTPLPATKSDRQSQNVGLGNLSLNFPNIVAGNVFQDVDCYSECLSIDEFGIWSNVIDILSFVKGGVDISTTYAYDQGRHQEIKNQIF